jgi:hypothetical protein
MIVNNECPEDVEGAVVWYNLKHYPGIWPEGQENHEIPQLK